MSDREDASFADNPVGYPRLPIPIRIPLTLNLGRLFALYGQAQVRQEIRQSGGQAGHIGTRVFLRHPGGQRSELFTPIFINPNGARDNQNSLEMRSGQQLVANYTRAPDSRTVAGLKSPSIAALGRKFQRNKPKSEQLAPTLLKI